MQLSNIHVVCRLKESPYYSLQHQSTIITSDDKTFVMDKCFPSSTTLDTIFLNSELPRIVNKLANGFDVGIFAVNIGNDSPNDPSSLSSSSSTRDRHDDHQTTISTESRKSELLIMILDYLQETILIPSSSNTPIKMSFGYVISFDYS